MPIMLSRPAITSPFEPGETDPGVVYECAPALPVGVTVKVCTLIIPVRLSF